MGDKSTIGHTEAEAIGRRIDVPVDAVETLLAAIRRGGGRQAQFSHPALGGMGQWSRGGAIMIGDMFNHSLKTKVDQLCNELAELLDQDHVLSGESGGSSGDWWPSNLGPPSAVGSQNDESYACFPQARRLAIKNVAGVKLYETGEHRISGVSQRQGGGHDLSFTSQHGTVRLSDLQHVEVDRTEQRHSPSETKERDKPNLNEASEVITSNSGDVIGLIERLHALQHKGVLTAEEFAAKKTELLARL